MELTDCECVDFAENRCSTSLCVPCSAALSGAGTGSVIRKMPQYYTTAFTNPCTAIKTQRLMCLVTLNNTPTLRGNAKVCLCLLWKQPFMHRTA